MVDVSPKPATAREAVARGAVHMRPETVGMVAANALPKGDVLATARIAGIMAAKRTAELIPLCHPLPLDHVDVELVPDPRCACVKIEARVRVDARTGDGDGRQRHLPARGRGVSRHAGAARGARP